jgi:hypothetical protein
VVQPLLLPDEQRRTTKVEGRVSDLQAHKCELFWRHPEKIEAENAKTVKAWLTKAARGRPTSMSLEMAVFEAEEEGAISEFYALTFLALLGPQEFALEYLGMAELVAVGEERQLTRALRSVLRRIDNHN